MKGTSMILCQFAEGSSQISEKPKNMPNIALFQALLKHIAIGGLLMMFDFVAHINFSNLLMKLVDIYPLGLSGHIQNLDSQTIVTM